MLKKILLIILFSLPLNFELFAEDVFIPDAPFVGQIGGSYIDPEFSENSHQIVFQDKNNWLWIGDLDTETGLFKTKTGYDYLIDKNLPLVMGDKNQPGKKFATNGPEWAKDEKGSFVVYTRLDSNGLMQQFLARLENGNPKITQLTNETFDCYGNMPSRYDDGKPVRLSFTYDWPIWKAKAAWISIDNPKEMHKMPGFDYKMMSMWSNVSNDFLFVYRKDSLSLGQIAKADAITGKITILTNDEGEKDDPGMFISPEYNNEILLIANVNNSELGIFRDLKSEDSSWTRIATIRLPDSIPYKFISSPEVITPSTGINGISYFSLLAREGKDRTTPGGIWIVSLGLDSNTRLYRRIDDGAITDLKAIRIEPEPFAGKNEVFVYYNYYEMKTGQSGLRRARTGLNISITNIHSKNVLKPEISIISPNPASDYIEINADNVILNGAKNLVKIYNTYGECVMEMQDVGHLGDVGHLNRIDISHLPFGFYFIRIGNYSQKFMVIR